MVAFPQQPAAAAVTNCHDVYFVSARGSGESYTVDLTGAPELSAVKQGMVAILTRAGSVPDIVEHQLSYRAPSVDLLISGLNTGTLAQQTNRLLKHNLPSYLAQERQGEQELSTYLGQILTTCAGSSKNPKVVLGGYSQGAMVVHNVLQILADTNATSKINLIAGSILVADPERMPTSQVLNFGTALPTPASYGACPALDQLPGRLSCLARGLTKEIPAQFLNHTVAVCDAGDLVCDTGSLAVINTKAGYIAAANAGAFIHTNCHDYCSTSARTAGGYIARKLLALGVGLAPLRVATQILPAGTASAAYSTSLDAQGGALPYTWSVPLGGSSLPIGLSLSSDGTIDGTPTAAGTFPVMVIVTDAVGNSASAQVNITINAPASGLTVNSGAGLAGVVSWVTGITCPAPAAGDTMWVLTQGAGQDAPDLSLAFPFSVYNGGAFVASSNDAVMGSTQATITCSENSDTTSAVGSITLKSYSFTQTITGPTQNLVITPATDGFEPPRFTIADGGGCGTSPHGIFGVTIQVYDYSAQTNAFVWTALAADTGGRWGPVTLTFPTGPVTSWGVKVRCSIGSNVDNSLYNYPVEVVPVP
jgi:hypothetical protein